MSQQADGPDLGGNDRGFNGRIVVLALLAIVLVVFIFQNTASQEIKFLGFESEPPLWVALLLAAVLGALVGQLAMWLYRRSRRRREEG